MALSTVIALFLPDFGPTERMDGGVGVVIRATMAVPVVFTLMYWTGRLITYLVKRWRLMSILMAGIERGIEIAAKERSAAADRRADEAERHADEAERRADEAERRADEAERRADEAERRAEEVTNRRAAETERRAAEAASAVAEELRSRGVSEAEIADVVRRITRQD